MLAQPVGQPLPEDGSLDPVQGRSGNRGLSLYVHVPFCEKRCGYCDFNTYTTGFGVGADPQTFAQAVVAEARLARRVLQRAGSDLRVQSVFFGGGTPTLLEVAALAEILEGLRAMFDFVTDCEITTEANPETVNDQKLAGLARAGFSRVSFGMQSAVPDVLRTLDRTHRPERLPGLVEVARAEGLQTSVDLIYGTPGESAADWQESLRVAVVMEPDHISAYSLVVEEGTRMWAQVRRGDLPPVDEDIQAEKYEFADEFLGDCGYGWYEISNWAKLTEKDTPDAATWTNECRHNLAYWFDHDWWGLGPGAHSHVGAQRWWNLKHPRPWADRVMRGVSPSAGSEIVDEDARQIESVMLGVRTRHGIALSGLPGQDAVDDLVSRGLLEAGAVNRGRAVLTLRGRLLADAVTAQLLDW